MDKENLLFVKIRFTTGEIFVGYPAKPRRLETPP